MHMCTCSFEVVFPKLMDLNRQGSKYKGKLTKCAQDFFMTSIIVGT